MLEELKTRYPGYTWAVLRGRVAGVGSKVTIISNENGTIVTYVGEPPITEAPDLLSLLERFRHA